MQRERENKNQGWEMGKEQLTFCFPLKNIKEEKYTDSQWGYQTALLYDKNPPHISITFPSIGITQ